VQAAADEELGTPLDGAIELVMEVDGAADALGLGLGLGVGVVLQAPLSSAPSTARITSVDVRREPARAMLGLVTCLRRYEVPGDRTPTRLLRLDDALGIEIERKFLVRDRSVLDESAGLRYRQGYLSRDPDRTVRVRLTGGRAFLTVKGRSEGPTRAEFEYEIPVADAEALLALCEGPLIDKTRHRIEHASHTWEVDVFHGANEGLVVAEVELESPGEPVTLPDWIGDEVTSDPRYYNANLVARPYRSWD
jgi:adenylate cyclase